MGSHAKLVSSRGKNLTRDHSSAVPVLVLIVVLLVATVAVVLTAMMLSRREGAVGDGVGDY